MTFRALGERDLHRWRVFGLVEREFESPTGERFQRTFLRHPGAVAIVPIDGDDVLLVRQFRPALGREMLELPAGTLDKGMESPLDCARRELAEEVGAVADHVEHLISYAAAAGISDEWMHLYVATGLRIGPRAADGIEEREMTVERMPLRSARAAITSGEIVDAKTIIGVLLACDVDAS
ncbi:MAG: NUDIX hydrolase [Acidimicrobiales bacterium]